jgi:hypothetical protein
MRALVLTLLLCLVGSAHRAARAAPDDLGDLSDWTALISFRPGADAQQAVIDHGKEWAVHHIEDAQGDLSVDYYSLLVSKLPSRAAAGSGEKVEMSPSEVFKVMIERILGATPPAAPSFLDPAICSFQPLAEPRDRAGWLAGTVGSILQIGFVKMSVPFDRGCVVLAEASSGAEAGHYRVSTVRAGPTLGSGATANPVSGSREFGYVRRKKDKTVIFYIIGADRPTRWIDAQGAEHLGGFEMADKLWKGCRAELKRFVEEGGGVCSEGRTDARRVRWDLVKGSKFYKTADQPAWLR